MDEYLTTGDAAKILGLSPDMIRVYEKRGRLRATKTVQGWRIFRRVDVEDLLHDRRRRGVKKRDNSL